MICDAHVHVGYWRVAGELRYYSPRRVVGVLNRCGVEQFIVSSTSPQAGVVAKGDLIREARDVMRWAGERAHMYCWVTGAMYDDDPNLSILDSGVYEGIKLHEYETPWNARRKDDLRRILGIAEDKRLNVMFHCSPSPGSSPLELAWTAKMHPAVRFNFAHCRPMTEMIQVMKAFPNVYTDVSCLPISDIKALLEREDVLNRVMFGSDFPAVFNDAGLTYAFRSHISTVHKMISDRTFNVAFRSFVAVMCEGM